MFYNTSSEADTLVKALDELSPERRAEARTFQLR